MRTCALLLSLLALACPTQAPPAPPSKAPSPTEGAPLNSDGSPRVLPPGPPSEPPYTLVLAYDDFGPQALAGTLLGSAWWQWEAGGSWEPGDSFDVRVVVYRDRTREAVEETYPTSRNKSDYRYVRYEEAIAFLDEALQDDGVKEIESLQKRLQETRKKIIEALGPP